MLLDRYHTHIFGIFHLVVYAINQENHFYLTKYLLAYSHNNRFVDWRHQFLDEMVFRKLNNIYQLDPFVFFL